MIWGVPLHIFGNIHILPGNLTYIVPENNAFPQRWTSEKTNQFFRDTLFFSSAGLRIEGGWDSEKQEFPEIGKTTLP